VKVECLAETAGDVAVYRVQVWTVARQEVSLDIVGENEPTLRGGGRTAPEADGKLCRWDCVITLALRSHPDPKLQAQRHEL
jgi:hypothetical protein